MSQNGSLTGVRVQVRNLSFGLESRNNDKLITELSLDIDAGQMLAIVGPSGVGKSTLLRMFAGVISPSSGDIIIDNLSITDYVESNPGKVSFVAQSPQLVHGSIAGNVALGLEPNEYDVDRVYAALGEASLREWLHTQPGGVGGALAAGALSGGELQRLAIARALFTSPKLLLLDEPTSALDSVTEIKITAMLESLIGHTTLVVVAHRVSTIRKASKVLVLGGAQNSSPENSQSSSGDWEIMSGEDYLELHRLDLSADQAKP